MDMLTARASQQASLEAGNERRWACLEPGLKAQEDRATSEALPHHFLNHLSRYKIWEKNEEERNEEWKPAFPNSTFSQICWYFSQQNPDQLNLLTVSNWTHISEPRIFSHFGRKIPTEVGSLFSTAGSVSLSPWYRYTQSLGFTNQYSLLDAKLAPVLGARQLSLPSVGRAPEQQIFYLCKLGCMFLLMNKAF